MPDRIVRDELLTSDRFAASPAGGADPEARDYVAGNRARLAFLACLLHADTLGNLEASDGQLGRLWRDFGILGAAAVAATIEDLNARDLAKPYDHAGKRYLHLPRFRQSRRYLGRLNPLSPWTAPEDLDLLKTRSHRSAGQPDSTPSAQGEHPAHAPGAPSEHPALTTSPQEGVGRGGVGVGVGVGVGLKPPIGEVLVNGGPGESKPSTAPTAAPVDNPPTVTKLNRKPRPAPPTPSADPISRPLPAASPGATRLAAMLKAEQGNGAADAWEKTEQGIERKCAELGISPAAGQTYGSLKALCKAKMQGRP